MIGYGIGGTGPVVSVAQSAMKSSKDRVSTLIDVHPCATDRG